jgi:hypothetical protein
MGLVGRELLRFGLHCDPARLSFATAQAGALIVTTRSMEWDGHSGDSALLFPDCFGIELSTIALKTDI